MENIINLGQLVELTGQSGRRYRGSLYDKEGQTTVAGEAIVCLTNSSFSNHAWNHAVNSIFCTHNVQEAFDGFRQREDISHIVLIPQDRYTVKKPDAVDDLIRRYLHS